MSDIFAYMTMANARLVSMYDMKCEPASHPCMLHTAASQTTSTAPKPAPVLSITHVGPALLFSTLASCSHN